MVHNTKYIEVLANYSTPLTPTNDLIKKKNVSKRQYIGKASMGAKLKDEPSHSISIFVQ